jgi:hypothetical protein
MKLVACDTQFNNEWHLATYLVLGEFGDNSCWLDKSCSAHADFDTSFAYGASR